MIFSIANISPRKCAGLFLKRIIMFSFPPPAAQRADGCPELLSVDCKQKQAGRARAGRAVAPRLGSAWSDTGHEPTLVCQGLPQPQWELVWSTQPHLEQTLHIPDLSNFETKASGLHFPKFPLLFPTKTSYSVQF